MEILLDFSTEEVDVSEEEGKVEAAGNPEIADFESFRYLKGVKAGDDELGQPRSLRKEHKESPFVSLWPVVVNFVVGQAHASAWVELEALDLPDLACLRPLARSGDFLWQDLRSLIHQRTLDRHLQYAMHCLRLWRFYRCRMRLERGDLLQP